MNNKILVRAVAVGLLCGLAGCGANNGANPVPGGPDFNHPQAAAATIQKQIAGVQASGEPQSLKTQQIAQLQGLLSHSKPTAVVTTSPSR